MITTVRRYQSSINKGGGKQGDYDLKSFSSRKVTVSIGKVKSRFLSIEQKNVSFGVVGSPLTHWDSPKSFSPLKAVARPTSSGFLFIKAAIISTIAGRLQGSFRWKVQ